MTTRLTAAEKPLPVVLERAPDELLSSWLRRHGAFNGLTEPMFVSWLGLGTMNLRSLDNWLSLGAIAHVVEKFRCDPKVIVEMTHASLPAEVAPIVRAGKPNQFSRPCWERHLAANATGVVLKSWHEGWRITCPVCGSPLSERERPRSGAETVRDTSPFLKDWDAAREGEDIVNRRLNGQPTPFESPVAMMRLLRILSWCRAEVSSQLYRKGCCSTRSCPASILKRCASSRPSAKAQPHMCRFTYALRFWRASRLPLKTRSARCAICGPRADHSI